jgi:ribosomal protein S18 acetylase RimI-like enzyme
MTIKIVKAEENHVAAIGQLWWESILFHQNIDPIFTPNYNTISDYEENLVQRLMKSDDGLVLVALDKEQAIGCSLSEIKRLFPGLEHGNFGYIYDMVVTANYRRNGIGKRMLVEITKWFKIKGINHMELKTLDQNVVANSFWQKQGFGEFMRTLSKEI